MTARHASAWGQVTLAGEVVPASEDGYGSRTQNKAPLRGDSIALDKSPAHEISRAFWRPRYAPKLDWSRTDAVFGLPGDDELLRLAARMDAGHRTQADRRVADDPAHPRRLGLLGERHLARLLGRPMDTSIRPYGTRRTNLVLQTPQGPIPVDVVTRTMPRNGATPDLILRVTERQAKKDRAMVLVVWLGDDCEPEIPGWAWESTVRGSGERRAFRDGKENWCLPISRLAPLPLLLSDPWGQKAAPNEKGVIEHVG